MDVQKLNKSFNSIIIGIQFQPNFSLEDNLGRIVDQILHDEDSIFDIDYFEAAHNDLNKKVLINQASQSTLLINNSNIVFDYRFPAGDETTIAEHEGPEKLYKFMGNYLIPKIVADIVNIVRIGYVRRYRFNDTLADNFLNKTIGNTLSNGINGINLSFSKRFPVAEGLTNEGINDYNNVIFSIIKKQDQENLLVGLDYQKYFDPPLDVGRDIDFDIFLKEAIKYNENSFLRWINENYEAEAEPVHA